MTFKLRDYQQKAFDEILSIYKNKPNDMRVLYHAPTGSGKTLTSLFAGITHAKANGYKHILWVAHQKHLSEQPMTTAFGALGIAPTSDPNIGIIDDIAVHCITWQAAKKKIDKFKYDMLIVDEVHQGSSNETEHKTFKKLLKAYNYKAQLYVSATPTGLDKKLFKGMMDKLGRFKASYKVTTPYSVLKDKGYLCNVLFKSVQTEDTIKLKRLADGVIEAHEGSLLDLTDDLIQKEVNIKDPINVAKLKESVANSMLAVYFSEEVKSVETTPPTLIFANSIDDAGDATSAVNLQTNLRRRFAKKFGRVDKNFVQIAHSRNDRSDFTSSELLTQFKDNVFRILIVVGMAKEGYDYPALEVILDFRPSYNNTKLFIQKTGRLLRPSAKKTYGRHYIPDTVSLYIDQEGVKKDLNTEVIGRIKQATSDAGVSSDDEGLEQIVNLTRTTAQLAVENGIENPQLSNSFDVEQIVEESQEDEQDLNLPKLPTKKKAVTIVTSPYIIDTAYAGKCNFVSEHLFSSIETKVGSPDPDGNKAQLIALARSGAARPAKRKHKLGVALMSYTSPSSYCYDEEFTKLIKQLAPHWFLDTAALNKQELIALARSGTARPNQKKDKLGSALTTYTSPSHGCYDEEFTKLIKQLAPHWFTR